MTPLLTELIDALRCLPGVGNKTAQRMAFYLLERDREGASGLAQSIVKALAEIGHCQGCRTLSEVPRCPICAHPGRDARQLCVVESPLDVMAIEQTGSFFGQYFVLLGRLSPLDGIGPAELGLDLLANRLMTDGVQELIIATNTTVEGQATAHYIAEMARVRGVKASRIAYGVPLGGELEYVDGKTLAQALNGRVVMN